MKLKAADEYVKIDQGAWAPFPDALSAGGIRWKLLHISPEACDLDGHMEEWLLTSAGLRRDTRSMWRLTDYCDGQKYDRAMSSISCPRSLSVFSCGTESNSAASIIAMSKTAAAMNRAIIGASSRPCWSGEQPKQSSYALKCFTEALQRQGAIHLTL